MNDVLWFAAILGVLALGGALIGIYAVFIGGPAGARKRARERRATHEERAAQAARRGWEYRAGPRDDFELSGRTPEGVRWRIDAVAYVDEGPPEGTTWRTNAIAAEAVQLYATPRRAYRAMSSWAGRLGLLAPDPQAAAAPVRKFLRRAREVTGAVSSGRSAELRERYVVLATDEALARRVFTGEVEAAFAAWLGEWDRARGPAGVFSVRLGGWDLSLHADAFLSDAPTLERLVELGRELARSYLAAAG